MEEDKHIELIQKHLSDQLSSQEEVEFEAWFQQEGSSKILDDYKLIWSAGGSDVKVDSQSEQESLNGIMSAIDGQPVNAPKKFGSNPMLKIAAGIALLLGLFYFVQENSVEQKISQSAIDVVREITLPDNSKVWLNRNSEIAYSTKFDIRNIELKGEAFFEIQKDPDRPFTIVSEGTSTTVLGTSFNVGTKGTILEVAVLTGRVAFLPHFEVQENETILVKGDKVVFDLSTDELVKSVIDDPNYMAWKTKQLIFDNSSLEQIEGTLEKYFRTSIDVTDTTLSQKRFTGSFDDPNIDELLLVLSMSLDITSDKRNEVYILSGN